MRTLQRGQSHYGSIFSLKGLHLPKVETLHVINHNFGGGTVRFIRQTNHPIPPSRSAQ